MLPADLASMNVRRVHLMSSTTTLSSRFGKLELPSWVQTYAQDLRTNAEDRAGLWPQDPLVSTLLSVADEIEDRALAHALEELTLGDAAEVSGYSYSAIQKMVAGGELLNLGDKGNPRVRRGDLPKKPITPPTTLSGEPDLAEMILGVGEGF